MSPDDQRAFEELDFRLRVLLPEEYQDTYESVQPVSMGSAGLKFDANGQVAWDEIWQTFCDLAMAGGPPHKGALLEQGTRTDVEAQPKRYDEVVAEICRGIVMATELPATESPDPGWVRVDCLSETMSAWLVRAIAMENVAVRLQGRALDLPASPRFRLEKEIKNVVTVIAKTSHYWLGHIPRDQKRAIADLFVTLNERTPLVEPAISDDGVRSAGESRLAASMADAIEKEISGHAGPEGPAYVASDRKVYVGRTFRSAAREGPAYVASDRKVYVGRTFRSAAGWLGLECADVRSAVWMMRALVASNVLARREGTVLSVPLNPDPASTGPTVVRTLAHVHRLLTVADSERRT